MAIDRAAIARAMLGPLGIEPATLGNHIFMRNQTGYQDNSGDVGKYNPARAAQLLDEAGWKLDGKVRKKDGRTLEINCVIPAAVATSRQESELIQNMLGQIGVRLAINTVPQPDFFEKYIRPGQFDFTVFSWIGTPFPISSARSIYAKPTKDAKGELAIQQNYARIGIGRNRSAVRPGDAGARPQDRRSSSPTDRRADLARGAFADALSAARDVGDEERPREPRRVWICRDRLRGHRLGETMKQMFGVHLS